MVQEINSTTASLPNPYLQINLMMDDEVKTIKRQVYTFIDAVKATGGMMSVIITTALVLA